MTEMIYLQAKFCRTPLMAPFSVPRRTPHPIGSGGAATVTFSSAATSAGEISRQAMTRRADDDRLFLTECEIALKVGIAALDWQAAAHVLEKFGLPRPDPLFGQRRYWPAVRAFLDRRAGMAQSLAPLTRDGAEKWDDDRGRKSRARP
jgi:hypothetical protein